MRTTSPFGIHDKIESTHECNLNAKHSNFKMDASRQFQVQISRVGLARVSRRAFTRLRSLIGLPFLKKQHLFENRVLACCLNVK